MVEGLPVRGQGGSRRAGSLSHDGRLFIKVPLLGPPLWSGGLAAGYKASIATRTSITHRIIINTPNRDISYAA